VTGERIDLSPSAEHAGPVTAQFVRTVPNSIYDALPRGDFRILEAYLRAVRSATRLVYLESQFLWAPELVQVLAEKLREPPNDDFAVAIVLPARPNNGADDTRGQLGVLVDADRHDRLTACSLWQPGRRDQVYVHAKIGMVDDRWLAIGSANLNSHSFYNDTEVCIVVAEDDLARTTRERLWREHLDVDEPSFADWQQRAKDERYERVAHLPHVSRRSGRFRGPINGLLVDG
jgi:phosphatidylserine/phosphatidylglycerophosphate/cardiolipin synthase-like enzyme